jgi:ABC-type dipeptide/oligopeptide/nickel transport system ATPase component
MKPDHLLSVDALTIELGQPATRVVDGVSFSIAPGEILGLAGESGSGKSVSALALSKLLPDSARPRYSGTIRLSGVEGNLLQRPPRQMTSIRGRRIGYVFQEPSSSFNPVYTIGNHLSEICKLCGIAGKDLERSVAEVLEAVGIDPGKGNLNAYPADFSGGMLQRLAIACALLFEPDLLVADEPTTALDTSTQKRITELLESLNRSKGMSILFISHDLALLKQIAARIIVMRQGKVVEQGPAREILYHPKQAYTKNLVQAIPKLRLPNR